MKSGSRMVFRCSSRYEKALPDGYFRCPMELHEAPSPCAQGPWTAEDPSVGTANRVPWRWHPQSWRGPQRKRSWRPLARSWQRAGRAPKRGRRMRRPRTPRFILKCSRSLTVLARPRLCFYRGRLLRAVFSALLHGCCTRAGPWLGSLIFGATKVLQSSAFNKWAMLGSNQRPLPCEVRSILSWLFAAVQKLLQISGFLSGTLRACSPMFVWVGVLLV